ncbi:MAG: bifunctional metallophosphatase/5'-nucleotidase [Bacteroidaceae bacterium]|nr:bifunctional metallophosphatase/5'-nucleotidase [Bacteroidaceae bacterium]
MRRLGVISGLFAALVCVAVAGCSDDGTVTVRVVSTSDIHGRIFDKDCVTGDEREGSMAKFSTFLNRQRKEYRNVIYLDAGDMLQGSVDVYQDVTAQYRRPSLAAAAFNSLGCYATVLGNHDFSVGVPSYDRFFRSIECPVLGANVYFDAPGDYLPPYRIYETKGVRIAILGMSTPLSNIQQPKDRRELDVADITESAKYWMPILKEEEKADVVIGLFHSGYDGGRNEDGITENVVRKILGEVPGFNLILFGHDHRARCLKSVDCNGDSVLLLNTGPFMTNAGVATVTVTGAKTGNPVIRTDGQLVNITGEIPDKKFMKQLSGWYDDVKEYSDSVMGVLANPLDANSILWDRSSLMDFLHSIQMRFGGAEVSLASPGFNRNCFPAGEIRGKDMFDLYSSDNFMVSVQMKGSEIRTILENSASQYYNTVTNGNGGLLKSRRRSLSNLVTAAGIRYEIDVTKPEGKRIRIISMSDGTPFDPGRMYRTTINSYQYFGTTLPRVIGITPNEMRKRLNSSSPADIRFYMITALSLSREMDQPYSVKEMTDWKLVPQGIVSECLAKDTLNFNNTVTRTSLNGTN